jgi:AbiU2
MAARQEGSLAMCRSPAIPPDDSELMVILNGVWFNTFWVKNALGLYEGITRHAVELDEHSHFGALVQQFSLDAAALGICKLFDRSTPKFQKNTVPELMDYLTCHFTDDYISRLDIATLTALGVPQDDACNIVMKFHRGMDLPETKTDLLKLLNSRIPNNETAALKTLLTYRNKFVAHQERVSDVVKAQVANLPSLDAMEKITEWASNFCELVACVLTNMTLLSNSGPSARIAALHVVAKILGKDFHPSKDGASYQEWETFYSRD